MKRFLIWALVLVSFTHSGEDTYKLCSLFSNPDTLCTMLFEMEMFVTNL